MKSPLLSLSLLWLAVATVSAQPTLQTQSETCDAKGLTSCAKELPGDFCCPKGNYCQTLADNTSAICCPDVDSCSSIMPITCDVRLQNVKEHPDTPVKTTVFDAELTKCGSGTCCPFGYTCSGDGTQCLLNKDQSSPPKPNTSKPTSSTAVASFTTTSATRTAKSTTTASVSKAASSSSPTTTSTTSGLTVSTSEASSEGASSGGGGSGPEMTSIIGGVVGGVVVLALIIGVLFCYCRRRGRRVGEKERPKFTNNHRGGAGGSSAGYANNISEPVTQPEYFRTDFVLKSPTAMSSISNQPINERYLSPNPQPQRHFPHSAAAARRSSLPNPFESPDDVSRAASRASITTQDEANAITGRVVTARITPIRQLKASSTYSRQALPQNLQREPSTESINIFADPETIGGHLKTGDASHGGYNNNPNRNTTFTDMMEQAELSEVHRGRPYVPGTTPRI